MVWSNLGPYSFNIASGVLYIHKVDYRKHSFNFVQVLHTHSIAVSFFPHSNFPQNNMSLNLLPPFRLLTEFLHSQTILLPIPVLLTSLCDTCTFHLLVPNL